MHGNAQGTKFFCQNFSEISDKDVYTGHIPFQIFHSHVGHAKYFSVVRDPYARAVSIFKHFSTDKLHAEYEENKRLTFAQHLECLLEKPEKLMPLRQKYYLEGGEGEIKIYPIGAAQEMINDIARVFRKKAPEVERYNVRSIPVNISTAERRLVEKIYADDFEIWERVSRKKNRRRFGLGARWGV